MTEFPDRLRGEPAQSGSDQPQIPFRRGTGASAPMDLHPPDGGVPGGHALNPRTLPPVKEPLA
jgi:hypothetical protein